MYHDKVKFTPCMQISAAGKSINVIIASKLKKKNHIITSVCKEKSVDKIQ